jgi:Zn-dependent protease
MFLSLLFVSPWMALVWLMVILLSLSAHEFSHAYVANLKGDETAERFGRLTLNPLAHIDPIGFIMMLVVGFGWAKPVPFDPRNLANPAQDALHIALAGPLSNLFLAALCGLVLRGVFSAGLVATTSLLAVFLILMVIINLFLLLFNLIPVPPLDGAKFIDAALAGTQHRGLLLAIHTYGPQILMALVILSIFTSIDPFFFLSAPAYGACDALVGQSCLGLLSLVF